MEKYEPVREIGAGNFGVARLMRNKQTHELVAMKFIDRGHRIDENVLREIINHRSLQHPNIIRFKEVVLTPTHLAIVMEYAAGGELFERIQEAERFSEPEARYFFQQLICGVSYCHFRNICHRDLKLENTLLDGSPAPRVKICDFGYSKSSVLHSRPRSVVGTPAYIAPEVLQPRGYEGYEGKNETVWYYNINSRTAELIHLYVKSNYYINVAADVWSCGVTLFVMLVGAYPFEDPRDPRNFGKTISRIRSAKYKIPERVHISDQCRNLISRIFIPNPGRRITMNEIKSHPWFLKSLPRELKEPAQAVFYRTNNSQAPAYSIQSRDEICRIVQEAQTIPKVPSIPGYGWGFNDSDDDGEEQEEEEEEEDVYDRTVRQVHASGEFDIGTLHI